MKIFLDTANVAELKEGVAMGLVDGCTTNPSLIAKEKRPFRPLVEEICSVVPGDVSLEVVATDFEGMVSESFRRHVGRRAYFRVPSSRKRDSMTPLKCSWTSGRLV
jgi:transaldolase